MNTHTDENHPRRGPVRIRPLAYDAAQAARAIGVSQRLLEACRDEWGVPYRKLGRRVVYPVLALEKWINGEEVEA